VATRRSTRACKRSTAKYADKGLVVLGVPSNDFGKQEPGTKRADRRILHVEVRRHVSHDREGRRQGRGPDAALQVPDLVGRQTIKWNFSKFLIGKNGEVVGRYEPGVKPESDTLLKTIEAELAKP